MSTVAEERAPEVPTGRAPDVGWALSPTLHRMLRDVATHGHAGGPAGVVGDVPYVPQGLHRASRVVVIGKRGA
jgi:hypothetical protein